MAILEQAVQVEENHLVRDLVVLQVEDVHRSINSGRHDHLLQHLLPLLLCERLRRRQLVPPEPAGLEREARKGKLPEPLHADEDHVAEGLLDGPVDLHRLLDHVGEHGNVQLCGLVRLVELGHEDFERRLEGLQLLNLLKAELIGRRPGKVAEERPPRPRRHLLLLQEGKVLSRDGPQLHVDALAVLLVFEAVPEGAVGLCCPELAQIEVGYRARRVIAGQRVEDAEELAHVEGAEEALRGRPGKAPTAAPESKRAGNQLLGELVPVELGPL